MYILTYLCKQCGVKQENTKIYICRYKIYICEYRIQIKGKYISSASGYKVSSLTMSEYFL